MLFAGVFQVFQTRISFFISRNGLIKLFNALLRTAFYFKHERHTCKIEIKYGKMPTKLKNDFSVLDLALLSFLQSKKEALWLY